MTGVRKQVFSDIEIMYISHCAMNKKGAGLYN